MNTKNLLNSFFYNDNIEGILRAYPFLVIFASLILTLFNTKFISLFILLIISELINPVLKYFSTQLLKSSISQRPREYKNCSIFYSNRLSSSNGMPSGHSQITTIFLCYILYHIVYNNTEHSTDNKIDITLKNTNITLSKHNNKIIQYSILSIICILSVLVYISRSYYNCHTIPQIIIGMLCGGLIFMVYLFINNKI